MSHIFSESNDGDGVLDGAHASHDDNTVREMDDRHGGKRKHSIGIET